ncbi:hypothetical protein B0H16DRAFT_1500308, partial [Mycena metata]
THCPRPFPPSSTDCIVRKDIALGASDLEGGGCGSIKHLGSGPRCRGTDFLGGLGLEREYVGLRADGSGQHLAAVELTVQGKPAKVLGPPDVRGRGEKFHGSFDSGIGGAGDREAAEVLKRAGVLPPRRCRGSDSSRHQGGKESKIQLHGRGLNERRE